MPLRQTIVARVDLFESPAAYVLVGHEGPDLRRVMHVYRPAADWRPGNMLPVEEERTLYTEKECMARLAEIGAHHDAPLVCLLNASALLGMVRFVEGWYMLFVTRHEVAGVIGGHYIYRVEETAMQAVLPAAPDAKLSPIPPPPPTLFAAAAAAEADAHDDAQVTEREPSSTEARGPPPHHAGPPPIMQVIGNPKGGQSLVRGGKLLLAAAFSKVATSLQLNAENWAETKYKNLFSSMTSDWL